MLTFAAVASTHWHHGQGWSGPPSPVLFLIPLLLGIAFLAGLLLQRSHRLGPALEIVAARYARGEIDEDEYQRRVSALRRGGPGRPT